MRKLMSFLMISCKKASALIVKRENFRLTRKERIGLFFHLLMCDACSSFSKQSKFISKAMETSENMPEKMPADNKPSDNFKEKIISKLK